MLPVLKIFVQSQRIKGYEVDSCNRRVSSLSFHQPQLADYNMGGLDAHCCPDLMKVEYSNLSN